ncbi:MAG: DUF805 domain-containing protein [Hyphomicrobiales bacterium]|nr:MAG: DUF805 domain-containing protein [Hyphomicrobiales bacterium]
MPFAHHLALQLVDPRGRANRRDFLHAAIALFALQCLCLAGIALFDPQAQGLWLLPVNLAFAYMACAATSRRLHDLGHSAWWMPAAVAIWVVVGFVTAFGLALILGHHALAPGEPGFLLTFACLLAAPLAGALWLHLTPGDGGSNQFGPPPGNSHGPERSQLLGGARLVPAE